MSDSKNSDAENGKDDQDLMANQVNTNPSRAHDTPASAPQQKQGDEEPDLSLEPDLPLDGRDAVGEAMIRDLPQNPELSEPPSQPHPSTQAK